MASIYKRGGKANKNGCYYITYKVSPGVRKTVRGCKDRAATEALARKLEADAMLRCEGVIDAKADQYAKAEARPLTEHLAEYHEVLLAKGVTRTHADLVRTRAVKVMSLAKADASATWRHLACSGPSGQSVRMGFPCKPATTHCGPSSSSRGGCGVTGGPAKMPWLT